MVFRIYTHTNFKKKLCNLAPRYSLIKRGFRIVVFNATFNSISILLVEETGVPGENHRPVASHWRTLSQWFIQYTSPWTEFQLTTLMGIGTNCTGSYKSNYHTITTMTAPIYIRTYIKVLKVSCMQQNYM